MGGAQLYIGIYLPFSTYIAQLAVTSQRTCFTLTPMLLQFGAHRWHPGSQRVESLAFNCASYEESAQGRDGGGRWLMASDERRRGRAICFLAIICEGTQSVHLPVCPYKVIKVGRLGRWGGAGFELCYRDCCASLAPSPVVRYASPPFTCCDFHYPGCLFRHSNVSVAY